MKSLMFLSLALLLPGCFLAESGMVKVDESSIKFYAGQKVKVKQPFYKACEGTIERYSHWARDPKNPIYTVSVWCPGIGDIGEPLVVEQSDIEDK